jgi:hypothetical protein
MRRKGFPDSYDRPRLIRFLADVKAGRSPVSCPVYSHLTYDTVPGATALPDLLQRLERLLRLDAEELTVIFMNAPAWQTTAACAGVESGRGIVWMEPRAAAEVQLSEIMQGRVFAPNSSSRLHRARKILLSVAG